MWLADVLACINDHPARDLDALLPWNWQQSATTPLAADAA
jgi:transposase